MSSLESILKSMKTAGTRRCAPMLSVCNLADRASSGICREWLVRRSRRIASAPKAHVETCANVGGCLHTIPDVRDSCSRGYWRSATPCQPSSHPVFRFSSSTKRQARLPKVRCKMHFFIYSLLLQIPFGARCQYLNDLFWGHHQHPKCQDDQVR